MGKTDRYGKTDVDAGNDVPSWQTWIIDIRILEREVDGTMSPEVVGELVIRCGDEKELGVNVAAIVGTGKILITGITKA